MFLDNVCQRLKVLCTNHLEKCRLLIHGRCGGSIDAQCSLTSFFSSVNVQCCYNEFITLRREFESEFYRNQQLTVSPPPILPVTKSEVAIPPEKLESTRIDQEEKLTSEEKGSDQLPDYSVYDDEVNASILRVLRHEDGGEEDISDEEVRESSHRQIVRPASTCSGSTRQEITDAHRNLRWLNRQYRFDNSSNGCTKTCRENRSNSTPDAGGIFFLQSKCERFPGTTVLSATTFTLAAVRSTLLFNDPIVLL